MKKLNYIILSIFVLTLLVVSCGEDKNNDHTPPQIFDVRFNVNDTIKYKGDDELEKTIVLNDSVKGNTSTEDDILVIGKPIKFRGRFTDNVGLSSAYVRIWGDSALNNLIPPKEVTDTCYNMRRGLQSYMYGMTEKVIDSMGFMLMDKLVDTYTRRNSTMVLDIRQSGQKGAKVDAEEEYYFRVMCLDMAGNVNDTDYHKHPITILTRDSVIAYYKKHGKI